MGGHEHPADSGTDDCADASDADRRDAIRDPASVESPAADVATFEDHMRLVGGRKQIYGTQFRTGADGKIELSPMEDSAHADFRREDAGLPPFKVGICLAKSGS